MRPLAKASPWLLALALVGVAFALRATGHADVFVDQYIVPIGGEAWYHLRRVVYGAVRFPELLGLDPLLAFPRGALPPWAPGPDAAVAALAASASGPAVAAARFAAWSPAALGALGVGAVYALLHARFGVPAALSGAGLLAFLPAHVAATRVGYVNHRAAGAAAVALLLCAAAALLARRERSRAAQLGLAAATGAASALALAASMSTLLALCFVYAVLTLDFVARDTRDGACAGALRTAVAAGTALLLAAPFAWESVDPDLWSALHPSRLHLLFFGGWLLLAGGCAVLWRMPPGTTRARRAGVALGLGVALDALALLLVPGLAEAAAAFATSLVGDSSLHAAELEPRLLDSFLADRGATNLGIQWSVYGLGLPLLLPLAAWREWSRSDGAVVVLVLGTCAALGLAAWVAPGGHAAGSIAVAVAVGSVFGAVWRRAPTPGARVAVAALALLSVTPSLLLARAHAGSPSGFEVGGATLARSKVQHVARWLEAHGRASGAWLDVARPQAYSVLAPWQLGHVLQFAGQRATVVDGFSGVLAPARLAIVDDVYRLAWFRSTRSLERFRVKYLIVPDVEGFPGPEAAADGLVTTFIEYDGSETLEPKVGEPFAVSNLRLVYEHGSRAEGGGLRVYEHVRGARVAGSSMPERQIRASLRLRTSGGREFTYRASTIADPYHGNYELRLPYATLPTRREQFVEALGSWVFECRGEKVELDFPDWKARDGATVVGPGFCY